MTLISTSEWDGDGHTCMSIIINNCIIIIIAKNTNEAVKKKKKKCLLENRGILSDSGVGINAAILQQKEVHRTANFSKPY